MFAGNLRSKEYIFFKGQFAAIHIITRYVVYSITLNSVIISVHIYDRL